MNNNAQNGSFAMLQTTKYCSQIQVKTHSTMLAIAPPKWLVLRKLCELIVLRVVREVIIFNNSNFTAVKKRLRCEWGGVNPSNPPLATPLLSINRAANFLAYCTLRLFINLYSSLNLKWILIYLSV